MNRILAIVLRQYYLLRGSFSRVMPLFAWVTVDIILWGFITKYLNTVAFSGFNFVTALLGAVLLWDFFARVMHGVTIAFFEDVWSRNFLNVFAAPISIAEYLTGLVLTSIATSAMSLIFMLILATVFFGLSFFVYGLAILPFLLILFLFGIALGIVGSAIVLRFGPATEWFIWPIPAFFSPFVGVFYPIAVLPQWMQFISIFLPPAYVFEGMRAILRGGAAPMHTLFFGSLLAIFYVLLACWFFARVYRHAVRTGLIARYSAESVS
ncbi:MAG: ABC transporter permease [Verrucomicrobiota bacterium]